MNKAGDAGTGLLGKVAKLIKSPSTDGEDLERPSFSPVPDSPASRQALRKMIERKRRNDFVRLREFDMLRKIRRKYSLETNAMLDTITLTSAYTDSQMMAYGTGKDNESKDTDKKREQTLRKIDEIEAQVSSSWFHKSGKTQPAPINLQAAQRRRASAAPRPANARNPSLATPPEHAPSEPPILTQLYHPEAEAETARHDAETVPPASRQPATQPPGHPPASPHRQPPIHEDVLNDSLEVATLRQDPEVEEAAISFANGDRAAAELALLKLVSAGGSRHDDVNVWLTLFDLYRVTDKADAFDGLVPEFTALFGRSAPQWDRTQNDDASSADGPALQATREGAFAWASPSQLNVRALTTLTGAVKRTAPPWRIDWRYVKDVEPDVLPQLAALFTQWADTPTQLQFLGDAQLMAVLTERSPTGDKDADPAWWNARLTLLRLMGQPDLFDQTALDYCITYEISPPAWTPAQSAYVALTGEGAVPGEPVASAVRERGDIPTDFAISTVTGELQAATSVFKATLAGEIVGEANVALATVSKHLDRIQVIDFDCRALRRVDFGAAGELLNWALEQQGHGRMVIFHNVHRLLASFFVVIGVNTVARVVLRKD